MFIYGVVNASPDSLAEDSVVKSVSEATKRAEKLLIEGADGIDLGGQGSTDVATIVDWRLEWERVEKIIPALSKLKVEISIDSWKPEVISRALQMGATVINAADGMQSEAMWKVASDFKVPIVIPFLSGENPRKMSIVKEDPINAMNDFFAERLETAEKFDLRERCILDPGTGFAPPEWAWSERFVYQKRVYSNIEKLRKFKLPIYLALPWKETTEHNELLEIALRGRPEFARVHYPAKVRQVEASVTFN